MAAANTSIAVNQDNISASLIGNRLFIDLNIDQAIDAVMDRANLTRLEHARHNAFSYSTNLRNLEAPWGLVYRIFLESVKGVLDTSMEVEEQIRVTAWNDSSNAPPQDLRRTLPLRSGIAKTVVPDLDVVLWGLIENLFPLLAELKPPITRAWLDIDGNPLHADATLSILARLWSNACNQVTYQARILFKKQKQTQKHQQSHIILMATVGDWFTCRGLNSSEDPTDLEELTQTLSVLIESEQKTTSGGEGDSVDASSRQPLRSSYNPTPLIAQVWKIYGADILGWTFPTKIRTPSSKHIFDILRKDMRSFKELYLPQIGSTG